MKNLLKICIFSFGLIQTTATETEEFIDIKYISGQLFTSVEPKTFGLAKASDIQDYIEPGTTKLNQTKTFELNLLIFENYEIWSAGFVVNSGNWLQIVMGSSYIIADFKVDELKFFGPIGIVSVKFDEIVRVRELFELAQIVNPDNLDECPREQSEDVILRVLEYILSISRGGRIKNLRFEESLMLVRKSERDKYFRPVIDGNFDSAKKIIDALKVLGVGFGVPETSRPSKEQFDQFFKHGKGLKILASRLNEIGSRFVIEHKEDYRDKSWPNKLDEVYRELDQEV